MTTKVPGKQDNAIIMAEQSYSNSPGMEGCPCTDVSSVLASLVKRSCQISDGQSGVMLTAEGPCVPYTYGNGCGRHDTFYDPKCALAYFYGSRAPAYCQHAWCYVDAEICKRSPSDRLHRSYYFPHDQGVDLFYSYTTCNSTADDWLDYLKQNAYPLGGISISSVIPDYMAPLIYKRNSAGDILEVAGSEYYDNSIRFEGALIDYVDNLIGIAEGDFTINYMYGSEPGKGAQGGSKWNGAIQDVEDGLADMATGPFWITGDRLKRTSFTVPLFYDKTVLFIPKPGEDSLTASTQKVLEPFTMGLWALAIAIITVTALMSVWFSRHGRKLGQAKKPERAKKSLYARLAIDEFLQKGIFFCSAGVEQDAGASLPQKLLMFGFSFFILILVSSYVANLAAFLTRPDDYISTMEDVVNKGVRVCASPIFETSLSIMWPTVDFVFVPGGPTNMVNEHKAGKCQVLATGKFDVTHSVKYTKAFCEAGLVFTESIVIENPIALPIRPDLAAGLSYWIHQGEKEHGITLEAAEKEYDEKHNRDPVCKLDYLAEDHKAGEFDQIEPKHLFFPIMFFLGSATLAVVLQLYHQWSVQKRSKSAVGRSDEFRSNRHVSSLGRSDMFDSKRRVSRNSFQRLRKLVSEMNLTLSVQKGTDGGPDGQSPPSVDDNIAENATGVINSDVVRQEDDLVEDGDFYRRTLGRRSAKKSVRFDDGALFDDGEDGTLSHLDAEGDVAFSHDQMVMDSAKELAVLDEGNNISGSDAGSLGESDKWASLNAWTFGEPSSAEESGASNGRGGNDATSRLRLLMETGAFDAFDKIFDCVQEIKRQKDN